MKTKPAYSWLFLIFPVLLCWGLPTRGQAETYNWQYGKTAISTDAIKSAIGNVCTPILPEQTADPNFCYLLQMECWKNPNGYGPCHVKNCRYGEELDGNLTSAQGTGNYYWYCYPNPPTAECSQLGAIWRDRILRDPTCQPR